MGYLPFYFHGLGILCIFSGILQITNENKIQNEKLLWPLAVHRPSLHLPFCVLPSFLLFLGYDTFIIVRVSLQKNHGLGQQGTLQSKTNYYRLCEVAPRFIY